MASPFLWNIAYATGNVNMSFSEYLKVSVNLTVIQKISDNIVDGYPTLMYGEELWFPFYYHTKQLPQLYLPSKVSELLNFYSILNFTLYCNVGRIVDFSYDIWVTTNSNTTSLQYGDFEVMIWMYYSENLSSVPNFIYVGNYNIPTIINGTVKNITWYVYILPRTGSSNGWTGVYLLSSQKLIGEVGVPITQILKNIGYFASKAGINIFNPNEYYLNAIQVGMKFTNTSNGEVNVGYTLYSREIEIT